ncbi:MAG: 5'-3' exonuclease H3TH domain-containing protein, partial [Desulfobacterales bacterium]
MAPPAPLYLIDGSAYIFRAYHAIRGLSNSSGLPTNAVFGFTRMVIKLLEERQPQYVGMFFDAKGPTFRHTQYPDYKANRPPMAEDLVLQLPLIKRVTEAFRLPLFETAGWEADDLIATLAHAADAEGHEVIMVTGDKDFMQLVTPRVTIWDPMKDLVIDEAYVREQFGVAPAQMVDVQGLAGDSADNVPGVPGIGMKTAAKLMAQFGSMIGLYEQVEGIRAKKQKENLINFKDQAWLSRDLVTIRSDAPIELDMAQLKVRPPDRPALAQLFQELEFRQLQQEYTGERQTVAKDYQAIRDVEALERLIAELNQAELIALDTETTSQDPHRARLVGFSFAVRPHQAWYIPCGHDYFGAPQQLDLRLLIEKLNPLLGNPQIKKVGQNIKYDWIVLERHGAKLKGVAFDTMVASYLLNPSKRAHNLDQIALDFLGHKTIHYKDLVPKGRKPPGFNAIPLE